ncbi:hypothetical protein BLOT_007737 [Blomia tropicalis]|nr:hypothetical protein BLOT_007737 [Blomia tropicalis]
MIIPSSRWRHLRYHLYFDYVYLFACLFDRSNGGQYGLNCDVSNCRFVYYAFNTALAASSSCHSRSFN